MLFKAIQNKYIWTVSGRSTHILKLTSQYNYAKLPRYSCTQAKESNLWGREMISKGWEEKWKKNNATQISNNHLFFFCLYNFVSNCG